MNPDTKPQRGALPEKAALLIEYLFIEDGRTRGQPRLRDEDEAAAREWLMEVLLDTAARFAHTDGRRRLSRAPFPLPRVRREWPEVGRPFEPYPDPLFRHRELLPDEKAEAISEHGVGAEVLTPD